MMKQEFGVRWQNPNGVATSLIFGGKRWSKPNHLSFAESAVVAPRGFAGALQNGFACCGVACGLVFTGRSGALCPNASEHAVVVPR